MAARTYEGLSRTSRLINEQFFGGRADEACLSHALPKLAVAIVSDEENARTSAAQDLIVTLASLLARMGIGVQLEIPDTDVVAPQPPLSAGRLRSALIELGSDLIPGVPVGERVPGTLVMTFVIGATASERRPALRLWGGDWDLTVEPANASAGSLWEAQSPFGALACAATAAAEGLRAALPALACFLEDELVANAHRLPTDRTIQLDLRDWFGGAIAKRIGAIDAISGGAITSAALYVLRRVPGLRGSIA
jgi:hypothetical protein